MFSYLNSAFGPKPRLSPAGLPARAACVAQPSGAVAQQFTGVHPRSEAESDPLSEYDPIASDPTRYETNPTRARYHTR
jgi:hypothetical protein